jgi:hypothetical protein
MFTRVCHFFLVLGRLNSVYILNPFLSRSTLILFLHLRLGLSGALFNSESAAKFLYTLVMFYMRAKFPGHPTVLGFVKRTIQARCYVLFLNVLLLPSCLARMCSSASCSLTPTVVCRLRYCGLLHIVSGKWLLKFWKILLGLPQSCILRWWR